MIDQSAPALGPDIEDVVEAMYAVGYPLEMFGPFSNAPIDRQRAYLSMARAAIAAWNLRPAPPDAVEALREALELAVSMIEMIEAHVSFKDLPGKYPLNALTELRAALALAGVKPE